MLAAQEMFRDANKVTKPEKALILGFMAGARGISIYLIWRLILEKFVQQLFCLKNGTRILLKDFVGFFAPECFCQLGLDSDQTISNSDLKDLPIIGLKTCCWIRYTPLVQNIAGSTIFDCFLL